ncbi:MFS transporter [Cryobacterium sp. LW097]|uniref:MFS transporter n=1 Tax=unclassified Cryobacterium TaxID=2649013 RepID=UPI000B4CDF38|nr:MULTISPECIES: MFS transporter [unclassified Cryobacterium]ASD22236.1 MFS transporter [Cryobacterium sp. LW097]TFC55606.1 MFS transporter [Cryobacterium sp. TMB3-1-2]TFC72838.1 MFS transporter [Cryobacterium sp. TMB3-15]TFC76344.1 MFS transporter [Cryobacterium sp. TMB3-10]TFC88512.1 MFS transporter [Cryobacterium sp. TMT4-31]
MSTATRPSVLTQAIKPSRAIPILLILFVFSLVLDNGFKFMSPALADSLNLPVTTVSLQATLAGILIGIGAVVYAALADSISIRKLIIFAIILMTVGSLVGFVFQGNFSMILVGRLIQSAGLAAAETLYVIYVTKHFRGDEQKKYLGFSTAAFQLSLLIGTVGSGFIATYIGWAAFFLVALLSLLAIPVVLRTVPKEATGGGHVDVFGLFLIAVFATGLIMFMQNFNLWYLLPVVAGLALFIWHIRTHDNAVITSAFFANAQYSLMIIVVFITYSVQLGYTFLFSFLISDVYGYNLGEVALLLIPGYVAAVIVGTLTGKIAKYLSSKQAITIALVAIVVSLLIPALLVDKGVWIFVISMSLFPMAFALMYGPLVSTAIERVPVANSGIAIGFYNLTINIAVPVGIAYTATLMKLQPNLLGGITDGAQASSYGSVLLILTGVAALGLVLYRVFIVFIERQGSEVAAARKAVAD